MSINIFGTYSVSNKTTYTPQKKCIDCPFFEEGSCWCSYIKQRITDWDYNSECPVKEIVVEEE